MRFFPSYFHLALAKWTSRRGSFRSLKLFVSQFIRFDSILYDEEGNFANVKKKYCSNWWTRIVKLELLAIEEREREKKRTKGEVTRFLYDEEGNFVRNNKLLKRNIVRIHEHELWNSSFLRLRREREREKKNERRSDSIFIVPLLWKRFHNRAALTLSVSLHSDRDEWSLKEPRFPLLVQTILTLIGIRPLGSRGDNAVRRWLQSRFQGSNVSSVNPPPSASRLNDGLVSRCWISNTFESTFQFESTLI